MCGTPFAIYFDYDKLICALIALGNNMKDNDQFSKKYCEVLIYVKNSVKFVPIVGRFVPISNNFLTNPNTILSTDHEIYYQYCFSVILACRSRFSTELLRMQVRM